MIKVSGTPERDELSSMSSGDLTFRKLSGLNSSTHMMQDAAKNTIVSLES